MSLSRLVRETPRVRVTRRGGGEDLLFVLGWGNDPEHEHVSWLIDRLTDEGYRVHAVQLPTNGWSFRDQYLAPLQLYADGRDFEVVLSHSTGGLVAAHLDIPCRNAFLSPWWGTEPAPGVESIIMPLFVRLPTARPLYRVVRETDAVGELKSETELAEGPDRISPAFLRTVLDAQAPLPTFDGDEAVFCTLSDEIVSVRAIGRRTPAANLRPYDGGHEFFASATREAVLPDVLAALAAGPAAIRRSAT